MLVPWGCTLRRLFTLPAQPAVIGWMWLWLLLVLAWTFGTQLSLLSCRCNPHRPSSSEFLLLLASQQGHTFLSGTEQPLHRGSMMLLRRLTSYISLSKQQLDTIGVTSCIAGRWIRSSRPWTPAWALQIITASCPNKDKGLTPFGHTSLFLLLVSN